MKRKNKTFQYNEANEAVYNDHHNSCVDVYFSAFFGESTKHAAKVLFQNIASLQFHTSFIAKISNKQQRLNAHMVNISNFA